MAHIDMDRHGPPNGAGAARERERHHTQTMLGITLIASVALVMVAALFMNLLA